MGANTSQVSDLSDNPSLKALVGTESISENDPFWNQLISFTFISPTSSGDSKLLEEAVIPLAKILIENNPRTGNFGALVRIFLGRTKELKISTECQDQLFIWQAHNALFMIRCLLKVFIREMSEAELHQQFSYQERAPGSCGGSEDLLEELLSNLVHLIVEVPLLDITYSILFEAVTVLLVFFSYQLFYKDILRDGIIYQHIMKGRCMCLTSRLVKTLLYNFIRQEKCPPPSTHIFEPKAEGGLLYGLASGVASALKLFIFLSVLLIVFDCHVSLSCRLCHTRKHRPTRPDIWFKRSPFCHLLRPWLTFMLYFFVLPLIPAAISAICLLPPADRSIRKQSFKNNIISGTSLVGNQLTFTSSLSLQAQDLSVIEEVIRMMLEIINSCLCNSLHHNPNLVYALLYKRELFEQFRTHPSFQDIMQNLDTVIGFFSQRLEQAGSDLSVERVQEVIMKGAQALPKDRLKKFPELKFKYVEEDQPEDFFIPYVWSLVFNSGVGLHWSPHGIELFSMDSG
uniref:Dymeclin n=1 Tax=Astatotilapia calliptera TaxID=8154 RepID=A0A3P8NSN5_ASTCA